MYVFIGRVRNFALSFVLQLHYICPAIVTFDFLFWTMKRVTFVILTIIKNPCQDIFLPTLWYIKQFLLERWDIPRQVLSRRHFHFIYSWRLILLEIPYFPNTFSSLCVNHLWYKMVSSIGFLLINLQKLKCSSKVKLKVFLLAYLSVFFQQLPVINFIRH